MENKSTKAKSRLRSGLAKAMSLATATSLGLGLLTSQVFAASISNMSVTLSSSTVSATTTLNVKWTTVNAYASGDSFTITWPAAASADSTHFGQSGALVSGDVSGLPTNTSFGSSSTGSLTINVGAGGVTGATSINITFGGTKITNPTSAGNFTVSVTSAQAGQGNPDFGSGIASVGGANQVNVSASVTSSLSFALRNAADNGAQNSCSFGALSTTSVTFCQYRLKVGTNAANGFTVQYTAATGLTNGSATFTNAAGSTITAGTEAYGFNVSPGSVTGGGATVGAGTFGCSTGQANCNQVTGSTTQANFFNPVQASAATVYSSNKPNNPGSTDLTNTALVTHAVTPGTTTQAGSYTATSTYTITGQF